MNGRRTTEMEEGKGEDIVVSNKQMSKYEKLRSFFSRDKDEILKSRRPNLHHSFFRAQTNLFNEKEDVRLSLKDDTIKFHHVKKHYEGKAKCQMLRSASFWSLGLKSENFENSIYIAYLALITNAESFIYIENQFFISSIAGFPVPVKNKIAEALLERIKRAAAENQRFKVIILMPLLPVKKLRKFNFLINFNQCSLIMMIIGLRR